jgi:acetyl-CoA carboxylase carboxyl transferase subunit alpha
MLNLQRLAGDKASSSVRHRHQNKRCTVVSKVFSNWPRGKEDADSEQSSPGPPDTPRKIMQESREMIREGREWLGTILSRFGPIKERAQTVTVLDFEKPLIELDKRIQEVRKVASDASVDVTPQIAELETRAKQLRKETYSRLTPTQRLQVARHPNRPTCLDIILNITDKFVELHGDRAGLDDPAIVCGIGSIEGTSFMFIGQQKGRNTKENIRRNFGMPQPNGYRKAMRFMRHANKFGLPIITLVDTPGAYAGKTAEELGQGEAIAYNLREMFGLRVPILSLVIGEGGSGGALAIGCANKNLILENSVYYVASPEACAAILWKNRGAAGQATEALRITAPELLKFGIMDEIIPEPLGGSHADPTSAFPMIKESLLRNFEHYRNMTGEEIQLDRYAKFRKLGQFQEFAVRGGDWKTAVAERAAVAGVHTKAGAWAANEAEAKLIEQMVDGDEKWEKLMEGREEWVNRPVQPPGLNRSGVMEMAVSMVEMRRRKQAAATGTSRFPSNNKTPISV